MPKVDIAKAEIDRALRYPKPFAGVLAGREKAKLGDTIGLTQFGVNIATLPPGVWSSQRHWHAAEDEFIYVLEGEIVLVEDEGEIILKPGDAAGFKANSGNGHCLINRGAKTARYLEVGTRSSSDIVTYSDIDMRLERDGAVRRYLHKSGDPYPA
jgi:uncharacterized cupin superfamily protein